MTRLVCFIFVILILKLSSSKPTINNDFGLDPELLRTSKLEERKYPATMLSQRLPEISIKQHLGSDLFKRFTRDTRDFLYKRILKRALQSKYQEFRTNFEDY